MTKGHFPVEQLKTLPTPFYYYDVELLRDTLNSAKTEAGKYNYLMHYAVKANANPRILALIAHSGLGADCVSGGEILAALQAGFAPLKTVFAGVGKADWEIVLGLDSNICCFNVESVAELRVIRQIAEDKGKTAPVALRINPEIDAHTHAKITTGTIENKFCINLSQLSDTVRELLLMKQVKLTGIHFHIGSQITDLSAFRSLAVRVNEIQDELGSQGVRLQNINFGGGLGIDYLHPNHNPIAPFGDYFAAIHQLLHRREGQHVRFEPGRSVTGPCGTLIARTLYVKEGQAKRFAILDAGFTELIRPAMYGAYHRIENLSSSLAPERYDVVGPICESSDVFAKDIELNKTQRGDLIALRSAGAYGEVMASQYNCRKLPQAYFSDSLCYTK